MKIKYLGLGFIVLILVACATLPRDKPVDIFQRTQSYKNFSFESVWSSALKSVDEVGFMVRNANKEIGLIHAGAKTNPDPASIPPRMNIIIKDEGGTIDVNFHIEFPGKRDDSSKRRTLANRFFKSLKKNLK